MFRNQQTCVMFTRILLYIHIKVFDKKSIDWWTSLLFFFSCVTPFAIVLSHTQTRFINCLAQNIIII